MRVLNTHLVSSDPRDLGTSLAVPFQACPVVIASGTLSGSFSTPGVNILHTYGFSVTATISGSLTGSVSLYGSNDPGSTRSPSGFSSQTTGAAAATIDQGIRNWTLITDSTRQLSASTLGGPVNVMYNVSQQFYKWLQVVWTQDTTDKTPYSSTGSIDVYVTAKGTAD